MNKTDLVSKTKSELLAVANRLGLRGISTMNKPDLVKSIKDAQARRATPLKKRVTAAAAKAAESIKRRAVRKRPGETAKKVPAPKVVAPIARVSRRKSTVAKAPVDDSAEISAHKFDVSPTKQNPRQIFLEENLGELPDSYGTGRLFLVARDPHWLFAYWDLTNQQMDEYRHRSSDQRLVLRLFEKNHSHPAQELTIHPGARNWYLPVNKGATSYTAELGFWQHNGSFYIIGRSGDATTPADNVSNDTTARFATIPVEVTFTELIALVRSHAKLGEELAETMQRMQGEGFQFPFSVNVNLGPWSAEQTAQIEQFVGGDILKRTQIGSVELSEWLRRRLSEETSSGMFSAFSPAGSSWSGGAPQRGFWFNINAEVIIYGATEPDAKVTIDGKAVRLRSDGTFSFHYTFPDGHFKLPVIAISKSGDDERKAELQFERRTKITGDVGQTRQPGHLKAPVAE